MDHLALPPLTLNHINAGLVAGSTNTITVTTAPSVSINGKFGTVSVTSGATQSITPTTDATTGTTPVTIPANYCAAVVFGLNAAGSLVASQGRIEPTEAGVTTTVGAFINAPQFPSLPEDFCPVAYTIVRVSPTGASFVLGTTNWAASGISCTTFKNIATLPPRPQIA